MKAILILLLLTACGCAQRLPSAPVTPPGSSGTRTLDQLQAENEWLHAQLEAATKTHMADAAACWTDDVNLIQKRYEAVVAQKKASALANRPRSAIPESAAQTGRAQ
jgi:hypothetical protein